MDSEIPTITNNNTLSQEYTYRFIEKRAQVSEAVSQLSATGSGQIGLVTIHLTYKSAEKNAQTRAVLAEHTHESSIYLLQHLRARVRKTDSVFIQQHSMYFVLPGATIQGAQIVEERLWEALLWCAHNMSELHMLRPQTMTIGYSAFPEPQASPDALLTAADKISKRQREQSKRVSLRGRGRCLGKIAPVEQETPEELPQLAKKLGIPYLSLLPHQVPPRLQQVVDARLAHELHCYPVGRARNTLTVAMRDPQDHHALERLQQATGLRIFPVLAHPEALENALKHLD